MRKFLMLLLMAALAAAGGQAVARQADSGPAAPDGVEASYDAWGEAGELSVVGAPGTPFDVYDASGAPVAAGVLDAPYVSMLVPNVGPGEQGVVLWVVTPGGTERVLVDPDWQWD